MKNKFWTPLMALALAAIALPAWALQLQTRVVEVNPRERTVTTFDGRRPLVFLVTEQTRFVDAKGQLLAVGLKVGDSEVLVEAARKGYFKSGSRLVVTFEQQDDVLPASQIQFADISREKPRDGEENPGNRN